MEKFNTLKPDFILLQTEWWILIWQVFKDFLNGLCTWYGLVFLAFYNQQNYRMEDKKSCKINVICYREFPNELRKPRFFEFENFQQCKLIWVFPSSLKFDPKDSTQLVLYLQALENLPSISIKISLKNSLFFKKFAVEKHGTNKQEFLF